MGRNALYVEDLTGRVSRSEEGTNERNAVFKFERPPATSRFSEAENQGALVIELPMSQFGSGSFPQDYFGLAPNFYYENDSDVT